jgi:hypothetical protein
VAPALGPLALALETLGEDERTGPLCVGTIRLPEPALSVGAPRDSTRDLVLSESEAQLSTDKSNTIINGADFAISLSNEARLTTLTVSSRESSAAISQFVGGASV